MRIVMSSLLGMACLLAGGRAACGPVLPSAVLARLDPAPVMDGQLHDEAWRSASRISLDHVIPGFGADRPEVKTTAWLGVDDRWLYVAVRCEDPGRRPTADQTGPDNLNVGSDDSLELFAGPSTNLYYHFMLGAGGATREQAKRNGISEASWKVSYQVAALVTPGGWSAEWAIPLYLLGQDVFPDAMVFNLTRNWQGSDGPRPFTWAPLPRKTYHDPAQFGGLTGLGGQPVPRLFAPRVAAARVAGPYELTASGAVYRIEVLLDNPGGAEGETDVTAWDHTEDGAWTERRLGRVRVAAHGATGCVYAVAVEAPAARSVRVCLDGLPRDDGFQATGATALSPDIRRWTGPAPVPFGADPVALGHPIGGGPGYSRLVLTGRVEVSRARDLLEVLDAWCGQPGHDVSGRVIRVASGAVLDFTGVVDPERVKPYGAFLTVPAGVTLAGDRGRDNSPGALICFDAASERMAQALSEKSLVALKPNARLTGLRLRGPDAGAAERASRPASRMRGVRLGEGAEVDNCHISRFGWACVEVAASNGQVRCNELSDTAYPVSCLGQARVEGNRIVWTWHAVAGNGNPGTGYEAAHNEFIHVGAGGPAHAVDMHAWRRMMRGHGATYPYLSVAGDRLVVRHNTFRDEGGAIRRYRAAHDLPGEPLCSVDVAIRGAPRDLALVYGNRFVNPEPDGSVRLYDDIGGPPGAQDRANLWVYDNVYGPDLVHVPLARETRPQIVFVSPRLDVPLVGRVWSTRHANVLAPRESLPVEVRVAVKPPLTVRRVTVTAGNRECGERELYAAPRAPRPGELAIRAADWTPGCYYLTVIAEDSRGGVGRRSTSFTVRDGEDDIEPPDEAAHERRSSAS